MKSLPFAALLAVAVDAVLVLFIPGPTPLVYGARLAAGSAIVIGLLLYGVPRKTLGLSFQNARRDARWMVLCAAAVLAVYVAFLAVATVSGWILPAHLGRDFSSWSQAKRYALNSLLLAPLVEELVYRGIVVSALRERLPRWAVLLASGAIFYLLHLSYGLDWRLFHFAIAGMILAWAYLATGKLWVPVTLHFLGNLMMGADDLIYLI